MRSEATKTQPKKAALVKPTFKQHSPTKQVKKKNSPPKKVLLKKSVLKAVKKKKVTNHDNKNEESEDSDLSLPKSDTNKTETSKSPVSSRSNSPAKKNKNEHKEKKVPIKKSADTAVKNKSQLIKKISPPESKSNDSGDEIKYKINSKHIKAKKTKLVKNKTSKLASIPGSNSKKSMPTSKVEKHDTDSAIKGKQNSEKKKITDEIKPSTIIENSSPSRVENEKVTCDSKTPEHIDNTNTVKLSTPSTSSNVLSKDPLTTPQKPKTENERPPKFFTSTRSPRTVDVDLKSCKTTKTNVSLMDKFLSMKLPETKSTCIVDFNAGESSSTTPKEPEIDVYTFTDYKIDSPKSILSDFRNPIGKNVGRVRPIARVKGTIIDKNRVDIDKKKYSPHRPIEEVVKQLKAGKRAEEARLLALSDNKLESSNSSTTSSSVSGDTTGSPESVVLSESKKEEKSSNVISKSYKMVARKSNIPGTTSSGNLLETNDDNSGPSKESKPKKSIAKKSKSQQSKKTSNVKKLKEKNKKSAVKYKISDEDIEHSTFSFNTSSTSHADSSSDESFTETNYYTKECSESDNSVNKKFEKKRMKGKKICDSERKSTSKDLEALSPDSLIDLKESSSLVGEEKPSKRRLKLLSMWTGPKKHRMASLNALAKVHCLYENESRTHSELGLMKTIGGCLPMASKPLPPKKKTLKPDKHESTSESEYEKKCNVKESSEEESPQPSTRNLRVVPGSRGSGKYWDHKSSTSSSEESEVDCRKLLQSVDKRKPIIKPVPSTKTDGEKTPAKMKKTVGVPVKKKRNRNEVIMDLKDMVVQKRMASLNATAILAASYEKRSPKSSKDETTTSDSNSDKDETYAKKSKNGVGSGVKTEAGIKIDECKKEGECSSPKQKVEVIVNQEADVTITGVYSTHHEGFCTVSGLKYRISSTSHTQTTATASAEKEGCSHEDGSRYTPLSALSSMQPPPADPTAPPPHHPHPHPGHEHRAGLSGLGRRPGCSSAFSAPAPPPATPQHHEPGKLPGDSAHSYHVAPPLLSAIGYYQPAGPLIKEGGGAEGRALARYHPAPPPHYHHPHPHPPVLQHYGSPYYAADLCYGRYYQRPPGYMPPPSAQPDAQMVGVAGEPYPPPPPQYYAGAPCYHNSPQRLPYLEYRGCPCPVNTCPKNVHIGPATGKPPNSGGPADTAPAASAPPGGAFRGKARATRGPEPEPNITNGKDPPPGPEPPAGAAAGAPHARYRPPHPPHTAPPPFSGVSPKREHYPDACEEFRVATDGLTAEALGPPSPARGSAGACVPQPPAPHPPPLRRARLGKDMVRKTLVGEDTAAYLLSPPPPKPTAPSTRPEPDDDVLVLSSPDVECAPIDLSSDETERRDPRERLVADVKKENEGPEGGVAVRKPPATDAHALREHNSPCAPPAASEPTKPPEPPKSQPTKRRYSRPKLEIEPSLEIVDARPTNGIGEHVKLQKRRKLVPEVETAAAPDRAESDRKKSSPPKPKRGPKAETELKRCNKRKSSSGTEAPPMKRLELEAPKVSETFDARLQNPAAAAVCSKPKNRSALLLDKLIRKNSVDRMDTLGSDYEPDPAELFLPRAPNPLLSSNGPKKVLNINNNVVGETVPNGARPTDPQPRRLMADMLLAKIAAGKLSHKKSNAKHCGKVTVEKVTSKTISEKIGLKNRLFETAKSKPPPEKPSKKLLSGKNATAKITPGTCRLSTDNSNKKPFAENLTAEETEEKMLPKPDNDKVGACPKVDVAVPSEKNGKLSCTDILKPVDKSPKLLPPKEIAKLTDKSPKLLPPKEIAKLTDKSPKLLPPKEIAKLTDKSTNLLCPKTDMKPAEASAKLACGRVRRRRSGGRRHRPARVGTGSADELPAPRSQPRWSNGWLWEGEAFVSKVYLNNDVRQDGARRCYGGMVHADGDRLRRGDCVLLRAAARRGPEQPFVARVEHMWENPDDGEMMVSLVWYYRPEHTELGRQAGDAPDEVFASRHRDANSVACIEDKCHVLTFNEYCRYRKKLKASEEGIRIGPSIVPPVAAGDMASGVTPNDCRLPLNVSPELVLFCRKIYDFRSKKIQVPNSK